jgi:hypothetical protein
VRKLSTILEDLEYDHWRLYGAIRLLHLIAPAICLVGGWTKPSHGYLSDAGWGCPSNPLLQPVAKGMFPALLCANCFPLALALLDHVLRTTKALGSRCTTDCAAPVPLHSELIFALLGNRQGSDLSVRHMGFGILETPSPGGFHLL